MRMFGADGNACGFLSGPERPGSALRGSGLRVQVHEAGCMFVLRLEFRR